MATDFGPADLSLHLQAASLSLAVGAEVVLVHAFSDPGDTKNLLKQADRRTQNLRAEGRAQGAQLSSTVVIRVAPPADLILSTARELGVDLVLLGTGGEVGRLGSTARAVVREASTPLWLVQQDASPRVVSVLRVGGKHPNPLFLDQLMRAKPSMTLDVFSPAGHPDPSQVAVRAQDVGADLLVLETHSLPALARSEWVSEILLEAPPSTTILTARGTQPFGLTRVNRVNRP